jgi:hypothetical protein
MTHARLAACLLLAACAGSGARADGGATAADSAAISPPAAAAADSGAARPAEPLTFNSDMAGFRLGIPAAWGDRFSVSERAEPAEFPGAGHAVEFIYLPQAGGTPPTLLGVVAYQAAGWAAVQGTAKAPKGAQVIAEQGGRVFVATRSDNPFEKGSPDALRFDSLAVPIEQVRQAFTAR